MSDTAAANGRKRNTESNSTAKDSSTSAGDNKAKENKPPPLSWKLKICYGLGHVWNDLCASLWFTYLLLFMKFALGFDENSAGVLMLIGQVADAIATPLAGLQVDKKYSTFTCWKYGHRKTWHLIGKL
jgi:Na+/melibiose symporter-like transporter